MVSDKFFSIGIHSLRVKPSHLDHKRALNKDKPGAKDVGLVNIMFSKSGTAINNMGFPQDGREVLRRASDSGHGKSLSVFIGGIVEVVFAFAEVDEFELVFFGDEDVGRLDVTVADALALEEGAGGDEGAVELGQFLLGPVKVLFLAFAVQVL
jgi:hypothetical protein